jgi:hypothetical protein
MNHGKTNGEILKPRLTPCVSVRAEGQMGREFGHGGTIFFGYFNFISHKKTFLHCNKVYMVCIHKFTLITECRVPPVCTIC